jgi:hypothetical protein
VKNAGFMLVESLDLEELSQMDFDLNSLLWLGCLSYFHVLKFNPYHGEVKGLKLNSTIVYRGGTLEM